MANENTAEKFVPIDGNIFEDIGEEAKKGANFFKMGENDSKVVTFFTEMVKAESNFQDVGKPTKYEYRVQLVVDGLPRNKDGSLQLPTWTIGNRALMQQLAAIGAKYGLNYTKGMKLQVNTSNSTNDPKKRAWFLQLLDAPELRQQAINLVVPAPVPAPVPTEVQVSKPSPNATRQDPPDEPIAPDGGHWLNQEIADTKAALKVD